MIPLELELENFLSYRQPTTLDLRNFQLACITGENGAGKSSLLDAITWALFGKCRAPGRDDVINRKAVPQGEAARVQLDFQLEGDAYRVLRIQKPGQTGILELQLAIGAGEWKSLTESTQTHTQAQLEKLLRMNYETFTNASFLLQGRADEFTIKRPGERKRILGELLGVSHWEQYREESGLRRREEEKELASIDGRLGEIETELEQEPARKSRLTAARAQHATAKKQRETQEQLVQSIKAYEAALEQHRTLINTLANNRTHAQETLARLETTRAGRQAERDQLQSMLDQAEEIQGRYKEWQAVAAELKEWESKAIDWNRLNAERQETLLMVERERSRLEQAKTELERRQQEANARQEQQSKTQTRLDEILSQIAALQEQVAEREACQAHLGDLQSQMGEIKGEQPRLKEDMQKKKDRQLQLQAEESGRCPLCDQTLTMDHRATVIAEIQGEGKVLGDRFRENKVRLEQAQDELDEVRARLKALDKVGRELRSAERAEATARTQLDEIERSLDEWVENGAPQLSATKVQLTQGKIAPEAENKMAELEAVLAALGYKPEAHATSRQRADKLASAHESYRQLGEAQAALRPLETTLEDLTRQIREQSGQLERLTEQQATAKATLAKLGPAPAVKLLAAERELNQLREAEVLASKAIGAAEQMLKALDQLREQRERLSTARQETAQTIGRLKILERAFGRNGVQALLIEQVLPTIQDSTNELLDRLTGGEMRVSFTTQRKLKSRDAMAETLDIQIRDNVGERPYEMYSGGEAFRVNFAIRIALSRLLAQRAGARLQTLVIDEGFGSQDPIGRQRLIEAINTIRPDFAKVLVITHIDQLKDSFPVQIEVSKGADGSEIRVI